MMAIPKASERAAKRSGRLSLRVQDSGDDSRWEGWSSARRALLYAAIFGSLAQEARALPSGRSLQPPSSPQLFPRRLLHPGLPAFLTAPCLPQFSSWAAGAPLQLCRSSPRVPIAAPLLVMAAALVSRGITSDSRKVPWDLHASGGPA